jgi:AraC-like DNA-binding protein
LTCAGDLRKIAVWCADQVVQLRILSRTPDLDGRTPSATVAASTGYADQAHLSREVKALAGVPLGALVS